MTYQDVIAPDGSIVAEGYRTCEDRYEAVRAVASGLRRPFTVLDLGAASGYFGLRLTEDFGARVVAVEPSDDILPAASRLAAVVRSRVNAEEVRRLGTFDMVLALSFLHHQKAWPAMLDMLNRVARSAFIVETPHPKERLRSAPARHQLAQIESSLKALKMNRVGAFPAVWDRGLSRGMFALHRPGLPVSGKVFSGSGNNSRHLTHFADKLSALLGYMPVPGSLNVRTPRAFRLGAWAGEFVDERRGRGGRRGGDYQVWHARLEGFDGPVHVMRPGKRAHGRDVMEIWAPVRLKDELGLRDGDTVKLRIGA